MPKEGRAGPELASLGGVKRGALVGPPPPVCQPHPSPGTLWTPVPPGRAASWEVSRGPSHGCTQRALRCTGPRGSSCNQVGRGGQACLRAHGVGSLGSGL